MFRLLLGAVALGCAILVGFMLGLRAGDRNRRLEKQKQQEVAVQTAIDTVAAPDTIVPPPVIEKPKGPSRQEIAQGVEYLASHNRWSRDEMEKIASLQGLWDAVNTYALDDIRRYNDNLASTPLTAIVEGLERKPKQGYYAAKNDNVITLSTYIKRLR